MRAAVFFGLMSIAEEISATPMSDEAAKIFISVFFIFLIMDVAEWAKRLSE